MTKKTKTNKIKIVLYLVILAIVSYVIFFSIREYRKEAEAMGIVVCGENECIKTMHIHADINFDLCGKTVDLPRETGALNGLHTHKEKNYLHFHDKVKLNAETKVQELDERLAVQEVIDTFELNPEIYCGTSEVEVSVLVNEQLSDLNYNWKDDDKIKLIYKTK